MKYPEFLHKNGTIGFVAPSFGAAVEPYISLFNNALKNFRQLGFKIEVGPNCFEGKGVGISNTPEKCGRELTEMYEDDKNDMLFSVGGGELMCEILDYVDFEKIAKAKPKWFAGYSDNTNFTFLLTTICDVASVYGANAPSFGTEPWHPALSDELAFIEGKKSSFRNYDRWELQERENAISPLEPYNCTEEFNPVFFNAKSEETEGTSFEGRLIGGCLDCLSVICGTKYDKVAGFCEKYKNDGIIWFIEACDLNPFSVRRVLWQLKHAEWFKYCKGVIIGRPMHYGEEAFGLGFCEAFREPFKDLGVPIIMDADLGHLPPAMPFISGAYCKISGLKKTVKMEYILK